MKTSINAWSVKAETDFAQMFRELSEAGFDGVELNLDSPERSAHSLTMQTSDAQLAEIRALSEQYHLQIPSISSSLHAGQWGKHDPAIRENAKNILRRQVYLAQKLGATGILVVPGGMDEQTSLLDAWKNSIQALSELKDEVKGCGVKIGMENVWNAFFTSPFDMVRFLDELDCPEYAVYFDAGNMHAFSYTTYWIEILGSRIDKVHVKGCKRKGIINQGIDWCNLTEGDIPWHLVTPALKKAGFDGYLTAEVGKYDETLSWPDYYRMVRNQVQTLCDYAK